MFQPGATPPPPPGTRRYRSPPPRDLPNQRKGNEKIAREK